jgi:ABC-type uncharacterized transport system permease subunit
MRQMRINSIIAGLIIWLLTTSFVLVNVYKMFGKLNHISLGMK